MASYVMGDIHGEYEMLQELLGKMNLNEGDTLYVMGDLIDRGPYPARVLRKLMEMKGCICLMGNHEDMALACRKFLLCNTEKITEELYDQYTGEDADKLFDWMNNGYGTTVRDFHDRLFSSEDREKMVDFMEGFPRYKELDVSGQKYILVHAGLGHFDREKRLRDYSPHDLLWMRAYYNEIYFEDRILVTGHTPTQYIDENPNPGYIYRKNNHIALDCGAYIPGGRLAAICLDTGEEFYSSENSGK